MAFPSGTSNGKTNRTPHTTSNGTLNRTSNPIKTVCIVGHNALTTTLLEALSRSSIRIHYLHSSSHAPDFPEISSTADISLHSEPNTTFTSLTTLTDVLSSLSPLPDLLVSTSHGGDSSLQTTLINACISSSIPRFIPAEFGHDTQNPHIRSLLPPHVPRSLVLDLLKEKSQDHEIEWIGLATGVGDLSRRLLDGSLGVELQWQSATVFGNQDVTFPASSLAFTAKAITALMTHWDEWRNQYLCVCGLATSYGQILGALQEEMGCEFEVGHLELEEGREEARRRIERGWPDAGMFLLQRSVLADERCFGGFKQSDVLRERLGLEKESLDKLIKGVTHEFKHHGSSGCGCG